MKILVRLPNWLGDMVMSVGALQQLPQLFPGATVSVVAKKGIHELLPFFPQADRSFVFDKSEYNGLKGVWRFGKKIKKQERYDLFVCLPDSFSSALMGAATGADARVGYKKEGRNVLLTHSFAKPKGLHRVEEYVRLLEKFSGRPAEAVEVSLRHGFAKQDHIVININSEAQSRRLTPHKAAEIIAAVRREFNNPLVLIGSKGEREYVETVLQQLPDKNRIESLAGKTLLPKLVEVLATAKAVLTTDSGPAHLSNALGTQTLVLFGAGAEVNTAPYNKRWVQTIRLGQLPCEPCTKNVCVVFETPQCLERLDTATVVSLLKERISVL